MRLGVIAAALAGLLGWGCTRGRLAPASATADGGGGAGQVRTGASQAAVPLIPIGAEAFRQWARLPVLRVGTRTVMRSTFDRAGGNEGADASHFLRQQADGTFEVLDLEGPGVLAFVRTNHWHGSPWHYVVDGRDTVVSESSTADPLNPVAGSTFLPAALFPSPLALTWATTRGADLSWVPIPFEHGLELRDARTHYGTGYAIVHLFPEGSHATVPELRAWDATTPPDADVLALVGRAGEDIAPAVAVPGAGAGADAEAEAGASAGASAAVRAAEGLLMVPAGAAVALPTLVGPAVLRVLELEAAAADAAALAAARIRIHWDGRPVASVDVPLPLFFGTGTFFNRDGRQFLVRAFLTHVRFDRTAAGPDASVPDAAAAPPDRIDLATYFPMPFFTTASIELVAGDAPLPGVTWRVRTAPLDDPPDSVGYFHATFRDHGTPTPGQDLVVLDTAGAEGSDVWCGTFAGMAWTFSDEADLGTLEGDPRFFFDDSNTPQAQGTGTEEWGGGGDYWGGQTMTLPFAGHPVGAPSLAAALSPEDQIESAYRYLVADAMPFGRRARIQLEHGGEDESTQHYTTVALWYGQDRSCLELSDALHVGDPADEARHRYVPAAGSILDPPLSSRYEVGVAVAADGHEVVPATSDTGRHGTGVVTFRMTIDPGNVGVLLRRKLDQRFPDQRALVEVADDAPGAAYVRAGIWSTAGSDVVVYSNPPGELDAPTPVIETTERRWREDEFLIARALTEGRSALRLRITFQPRGLPLVPGAAPGGATPPPEAWSEYRYWAYSWKYPPVVAAGVSLP